MNIKTFVWCLLLLAEAHSLQLINGNLNLNLIFLEDGSIELSLTLDGVEKMSGQIGEGANVGKPSTVACEGASSCFLQNEEVTLSIDNIDSGFSISWQTNNVTGVFQDCLDLNISEINWFGGPEKFYADWPVENSKFVNRPYTTIKADNGAVGERYWLNSKGAYIFIHDQVPLFLDQNNLKSNSICFIGSLTKPYIGRKEVLLKYSLVAKNDPKEAHLNAVNNFLGKPQGYPDEWIIRNPIWTTWAKYKKNIDDETVVAFANEIADHGFTGQIEIDDYWETCYGSLIFNNEQFANINDTVKSLKDLGFTVTLWTHPFVNHDCQETMTYGQEHGYFAKAADGSDQTSWWDGNPAHYIDFTNDEARSWFIDRLKLLQELHGIDSFKFDAGESDYPPPNAVFSGDVEMSPNSITSAYVRTCATFGGLIEVRSATQDLPIFLRILDKDSRWSLNNGLHSLITSLLQLNINGYTLVLPDMIGGNGYAEQPTAELIARWTQANTFMPTMQFSYLPWDITSEDFDGLEIIKKYVALHEQYADEILNAMNNSITNGIPVNPPIWWVDPLNVEALKVNDQYLLGEKILVAPVIQEGAISRDVYLPSGSWKDGNDGTIYEGPQLLKAYASPIDVLPFFIKQ
ncbi:putative family 31 glucosidase [Asbolus verrucosus]|uniref:Putative family 31 glucosidase n=1 Tax=Asbolus verrucosus TaxID=1661398 RepID=A0A482V9Q7_ASBVE|nr:putative family 31 glucosidase [Asbolus verrucosus]